MYCKNCGFELKDTSANFCPNCGQSLATTNDGKVYDNSYNETNGYYEPIHNQNLYSNGDAPNGGLAFLSFLFPIVGLVLYIIWHAQDPLKAKSCLKGMIFGFVFGIFIFCCCLSSAGSSSYYYYSVIQSLF